ncbi:MAG: short-subunit dehydrogenase [Cyclobacteriaceae bacterium]|jgi:short-subunit dehydrogenase
MSILALITGASSGIGKALAFEHAKTGGDLIISGRSTTKLQQIKEELEVRFTISVTVLPKDLSIQGAAEELYDDIHEKGLKVDYLINNAGFGDYGLFHESEWEKQEEMINLNIIALTHLTRLFLPEMVKRQQGKIMQVASTAAFQPGPLMAVYYATKHYVLAFSEAIANEVAKNGVTVTTLCPGATLSGFSEAAAMEDSRLFKNKQLPSSEQVAKYGYRAMLEGKTVAIHGWKNALMATGVRFAPRKAVTKFVKKFQGRAD